MVIYSKKFRLIFNRWLTFLGYSNKVTRNLKGVSDVGFEGELLLESSMASRLVELDTRKAIRLPLQALELFVMNEKGGTWILVSSIFILFAFPFAPRLCLNIVRGRALRCAGTAMEIVP